jgi:hypothetical protein
VFVVVAECVRDDWCWCLDDELAQGGGSGRSGGDAEVVDQRQQGYVPGDRMPSSTRATKFTMNNSAPNKMRSLDLSASDPLTDDLDGTNIPAGKGETITFALDGKNYEIDLTSKNGNALRALKP